MRIANTWSLPLLALTLLLAGCNPQPGTPSASTSPANAAKPAEVKFMQDEHALRQQRLDKLLAPDGWTSLIGLHWIDPGSHYLGSDPGNGIRLSMGPPHLGMLDIHADKTLGDSIRFVADKTAALTLDGKPLVGATTLKSDVDEGGPSRIGFDDGKGEATVIRRGDRYALRVKHADAPARVDFVGLDYWPAAPEWKVAGTFVPHAKNQTIDVASIIGTNEPMANPGVIEFVHDGKTHRIEALDEGEGTLFLVFADRTNGHGSYGAGRFLDIPMPDAHNKVVIDFNQSRNPPCAFTAFATCPLPPPENRLDLAITAGEKAYRKPHEG